MWDWSSLVLPYHFVPTRRFLSLSEQAPADGFSHNVTQRPPHRVLPPPPALLHSISSGSHDTFRSSRLCRSYLVRRTDDTPSKSPPPPSQNSLFFPIRNQDWSDIRISQACPCVSCKSSDPVPFYHSTSLTSSSCTPLPSPAQSAVAFYSRSFFIEIPPPVFSTLDRAH